MGRWSVISQLGTNVSLGSSWMCRKRIDPLLSQPAFTRQAVESCCNPPYFFQPSGSWSKQTFPSVQRTHSCIRSCPSCRLFAIQFWQSRCPEVTVYALSTYTER